MRFEPAQGARQPRHPQASPAGIEPQIAHSYARAGVKLNLLWEHAELGSYAQGWVININSPIPGTSTNSSLMSLKRLENWGI